MENFRAHRTNRPALERPHARQHLIKHNAERELIRALVLRLPANEFRGQISRCAQQTVGAGGLCRQARDAEVAELYLLLRRNENVSRFNVTVDDSRAMRQREGASQIRGPGTGALDGHRKGTEALYQSFSGNVFHDKEWHTLFVDAHVVEVHDGGMRKLADELGFAEELVFQVVAEAADKGLQGDGTANDVVARHFDAARGTGADQFQGLVAAFLQCNHQAERNSRVARSRRPCAFDGGTGATTGARRA